MQPLWAKHELGKFQYPVVSYQFICYLIPDHSGCSLKREPTVRFTLSKSTLWLSQKLLYGSQASCMAVLKPTIWLSQRLPYDSLKATCMALLKPSTGKWLSQSLPMAYSRANIIWLSQTLPYSSLKAYRMAYQDIPYSSLKNIRRLNNTQPSDIRLSKCLSPFSFQLKLSFLIYSKLADPYKFEL